MDFDPERAVTVQVSIDVTTVDEALAVAEMALRAGVDWLEVGTPLILFCGIPAIGPIASAHPGREIFADIKLIDGARKYVVAASRLGATMVSICGVASDASIREAVAGGRETGARIVVDLYASPDPVARAREVAGFGVDLIYLHYGGDQRAAAPELDGTLALISAGEGSGRHRCRGRHLRRRRWLRRGRGGRGRCAHRTPLPQRSGLRADACRLRPTREVGPADGRRVGLPTGAVTGRPPRVRPAVHRAQRPSAISVCIERASAPSSSAHETAPASKTPRDRSPSRLARPRRATRSRVESLP